MGNAKSNQHLSDQSVQRFGTQFETGLALSTTKGNFPNMLLKLSPAAGQPWFFFVNRTNSQNKEDGKLQDDLSPQLWFAHHRLWQGRCTVTAVCLEPHSTLPSSALP